jgi:hypothetical protein
LLLGILGAIGNIVPIWALPVILIGGLLGISIVGALQLRNDDKLKEEHFVTLMIESFKYLPLIRNLQTKKATQSVSEEDHGSGAEMAEPDAAPDCGGK